MPPTFAKKTVDNEVKTVGEVAVEISTVQANKTVEYTLDEYDAMITREGELRDGYIASIATMKANRVLMLAEAEKVTLKTKD